MKYQCLMIDDDVTIAETTAEYFNIFDIKTAYVTSYEEAEVFLREHQVSLLLLDINLGDRSGFELCKQVREDFDMPILFISARTSDDDVLTALNIGGDDYIKKPYTLNILLAINDLSLILLGVSGNLWSSLALIFLKRRCATPDSVFEKPE